MFSCHFLIDNLTQLSYSNVFLKFFSSILVLALDYFTHLAMMNRAQKEFHIFKKTIRSTLIFRGSELFQLAIIAKENIGIDLVLNPVELNPKRPSCILDTTDGNKSEVQKDARFASYLAESPSLKLDKKINSMRPKEAEKELISMLFSPWSW